MGIHSALRQNGATIYYAKNPSDRSGILNQLLAPNTCNVSHHDPETPTPNHFLLGNLTGLTRTGPCDKADGRTWRISQALADLVGARVLADNATAWPIGVIERKYPGPETAFKSTN